MKILFLVPYPLASAASQRFRFEQYLHVLEDSGAKIKVRPFLAASDWKIMYKKGHLLRKTFLMLRGFISRSLSLFEASFYDLLFIHREATPVGPPWFEWIAANILNRKIIYDFDDAIWLTDRTNESWLEKKIRYRDKVKLICKWSYKVSTGNRYLHDFARAFNKNVIINPTTIDTEKHHNPNLFDNTLKGSVRNKKVTIGWSGSHSTIKYLEMVYSVLKQIEEKYSNVSFLIIADRQPFLDLKNLIYKKWTKETEIEDLMNIDIGIMPLPDDIWAKGKCGFKILQYMALQIPAVASSVGVNTDIIEDELNGYLCATDDDWFTKLEALILDVSKRSTMGNHGRRKVVDHYSVLSNSSNFLSLFQLK